MSRSKKWRLEWAFFLGENVHNIRQRYNILKTLQPLNLLI